MSAGYRGNYEEHKRICGRYGAGKCKWYKLHGFSGYSKSTWNEHRAGYTNRYYWYNSGMWRIQQTDQTYFIQDKERYERTDSPIQYIQANNKPEDNRKNTGKNESYIRRRYQKYNNVKEENIIDFRGIVINNDTHEFIFNNEKIELTKTEFAILWLLCENRGSVVKSDTLFSTVWKENYFEKDNNTIMVHIRHIREKMKDTYSKPKYIKTIYGVGYKIEK